MRVALIIGAALLTAVLFSSTLFLLSFVFTKLLPIAVIAFLIGFLVGAYNGITSPSE